MTAAGAVPSGYREVLYWKLTDSRKRLILINLLAIPLLVIAALAATAWLSWLGAGGAGALGALLNGVLADAPPWINAALTAAAVVVTLTLHEAAHGLAMSAFGASPRYGVKWRALALYTTAPGYAFTRNQYLVVILAPLASVSLLAGLIMAALAGTPLASLAALGAIVNAAGACGDVWMAVVTGRHPPSAYVIDEADGMRVFQPIEQT